MKNHYYKIHKNKKPKTMNQVLLRDNFDLKYFNASQSEHKLNLYFMHENGRYRKLINKFIQD